MLALGLLARSSRPQSPSKGGEEHPQIFKLSVTHQHNCGLFRHGAPGKGSVSSGIKVTIPLAIRQQEPVQDGSGIADEVIARHALDGQWSPRPTRFR